MTHVPHHPAPHRHRARDVSLALGLAGGPAAWLIQMSFNYGLSSHACFPADEPLSAWTAGLPWWLIVAVNLAAIAAAAFAAALAYRNWRLTREEAPGQASASLEAGEGRTRFLSLWGIMASTGFVVALLFNAVNILGVPPCGYS